MRISEAERRARFEEADAAAGALENARAKLVMATDEVVKAKAVWEKAYDAAVQTLLQKE